MYGFYKVGTGVFETHIGDINYNTEQIIKIINKFDGDVLVFPELSVTGYTCGDMFTHKSFLQEVENAIHKIARSTRTYKDSLHTETIIIIGAPVIYQGEVYNCAIVIQDGRLLGIVPKSFIPNYNEFYEARWFTNWYGVNQNITYINQDNIPMGYNQLFIKEELRLACEICEDLWVPNAPSNRHSLNDANCIVNLSASNEIVGKKQYRRDLVKMQSGRCSVAYVYCSSGFGESTSDVVWSGHQIIAECGHIIKEDFFNIGRDYLITEAYIDTEKIDNDRIRQNSRLNTLQEAYTLHNCYTSATFRSNIFPKTYEAYPFIPKNKNKRKERCDEILKLQATGLATRLKKTHINKMVIGISGGLDSTLALLVCLETCKLLKLPTTNIIGVTMPCYGTTDRTLTQAEELMTLTDIMQLKIDIKKAVTQHLKDIQHEDIDVVYENAQARERTQVLMDVANRYNALVIGTGDLSEIALGWCTYNADHMSMYSVNCSIPKTLVKYIIETYAEEHEQLNDVLTRIYNTKISPELLPAKNGKIEQCTEGILGKYDLHDFFLYNFIRNGFNKDKIKALAMIAFPQTDKSYIISTLDLFFKRFYQNQFKRNCVPDGVKIGSVSLSPRGDWRFPSEFLN